MSGATSPDVEVDPAALRGCSAVARATADSRRDAASRAGSAVPGTEAFGSFGRPAALATARLVEAAVDALNRDALRWESVADQVEAHLRDVKDVDHRVAERFGRPR